MGTNQDPRWDPKEEERLRMEHDHGPFVPFSTGVPRYSPPPDYEPSLDELHADAISAPAEAPVVDTGPQVVPTGLAGAQQLYAPPPDYKPDAPAYAAPPDYVPEKWDVSPAAAAQYSPWHRVQKAHEARQFIPPPTAEQHAEMEARSGVRAMPRAAPVEIGAGMRMPVEEREVAAPVVKRPAPEAKAEDEKPENKS
jgi:hypothetical protein